MASSNIKMPPSILKNVENDYDKRNNNNLDIGPASSRCHPGSVPTSYTATAGRNSRCGSIYSTSSNLEEISSHCGGIDIESHVARATKPASVSFSVSSPSPVTESSSDKVSLLSVIRKGKNKLCKGKTKNEKSTKNNISGNNNNKNLQNDKRSVAVAFQNPLSGASPSSGGSSTTSSSSGSKARKHPSSSSISIPPEAYTPSQMAVTIFEEEAELRHAPWMQAGIPR